MSHSPSPTPNKTKYTYTNSYLGTRFMRICNHTCTTFMLWTKFTSTEWFKAPWCVAACYTACWSGGAAGQGCWSQGKERGVYITLLTSDYVLYRRCVWHSQMSSRDTDPTPPLPPETQTQPHPSQACAFSTPLS